MNLEKLTGNAKVIAILCNQWGDTGKGKFSEAIAHDWAEVTARGTGGANAGHTRKVNEITKISHLLPASMEEDSRGMITVLGNGMVIDLRCLVEEMNEVISDGGTLNHLMISQDAHVTMPYHVSRDKSENQSQANGGIGSTGKGIGPTYADKIYRRGIQIRDLLDKDGLVKKLRDKNLTSDVDDVVDGLMPYVPEIKPFVRDTVTEMHRFMREGKRILIEGAQGLLLSIEHGTYPHVTSSDCSINGTASGVGLSAKIVDLPFGIVKFPFMTRVGGGAFPTELGILQSEEYCGRDSGNRLKDELTNNKIPFTEENGKIIYDPRDPIIMDMINKWGGFIQGQGIRLAAGEYGATTKRPRRVGWTDAVAAKYAVGINGPLMILTKPDSLSGVSHFKVNYGYKDGSNTRTDFPRDEKTLRSMKPDYKTYNGYEEISEVREYEDLPRSLQQAISDFEKFTGGKVAIVSVGADREETIVR